MATLLARSLSARSHSGADVCILHCDGASVRNAVYESDVDGDVSDDNDKPCFYGPVLKKHRSIIGHDNFLNNFVGSLTRSSIS